MRNANEQDVARAKATGKLEENVMYLCNGGTKAHGKNVSPAIVSLVQREVGSTYKIAIAENVNGYVLDVDINTLAPIKQKGPAQQPKKPRRKPVRGTKPETKIPMSADVKLEVGDVVLLDNGGRGTVKEVDTSKDRLYAGAVFVDAGKYNYEPEVNKHGVWFFDKTFQSNVGNVKITHKIVPWQEQQEKRIELKITPEVIKDIGDLLKSPAQEAFEAGYWVAHTALPGSQVPSFVAENFVEVILACGDIVRTLSKRLRWSSDASKTGAEIVAYRMAQ